MATPTRDAIRRAPKVLLHDHLDGGVRPATVIELARDVGHELPSYDVEELGGWFTRTASAGNLEQYLETFAHTVSCLQTTEALTRVAAECAEDLAADGVVYAEVRFAPELHLRAELDLDRVVEAVLRGFADGERRAREAGNDIRVGTLITAMRHAARSLEIADLAVRWRDDGVVGFDIAGAERGFPPSRHLDAFDHVREANGNVTIHAGEGFGLPSIWEALQICGAHRLGHGVRIVDDIHEDRDGAPVLGRLASYVRDKRVPLEMCPASNVQTGAAKSVEDHPIGLLRRLHFRVTVNTDNRLMSNTSMTAELASLVDAFDYTWDDLRWLTVNALKSSFIPFDERLALINDVVKPAYTSLAAETQRGER